MTLMKTLMLSSALALGATSLSAEPIKVTTIDTKADFSAIADSNALTFWPNIAADLKSALGDALQPYAGPDGWTVEVALDEVSMDGKSVLADGGIFNRMKGTVAIKDPKLLHIEKYTLDVNAAAERPSYVPADAILIAPTQDHMYETMIKAYAASVAEKVSTMTDK